MSKFNNFIKQYEKLFIIEKTSNVLSLYKFFYKNILNI